MRANSRGGYDVLLTNSQGKYLACDYMDDPIWVDTVDAARAEDTDASMMTIALLYGFADEKGKLRDGYALAHIPWVNPDLELEDRFYDSDANAFRLDAIRDYVFGTEHRS